MNAFRRDRWSASSGGTHSLLGGQFAVYLRLISPYLSPVYRAASISYQRHINFMLTAARINTLFTTGLRPEAVALRARPQAGVQGLKASPAVQGRWRLRSRRRRGVWSLCILPKKRRLSAPLRPHFRAATSPTSRGGFYVA